MLRYLVARQYKRVYDLTIIPEDGEARVIRDLRITFEITKSILSFPNLCKLIIYNLKDMNDYHDLKKGKLKMQNVSFNLRDCLNEVVDIVKFKA